jgi:hypothetical protein
VAVAGLGISWLRDNLRIIDNTAECQDIAKSVSAAMGSCVLGCGAMVGREGGCVCVGGGKGGGRTGGGCRGQVGEQPESCIVVQHGKAGPWLAEGPT